MRKSEARNPKSEKKQKSNLSRRQDNNSENINNSKSESRGKAEKRKSGSRKRSTRTAAVLATLGKYESRNVTFVDPEGGWPIVWTKAKGVHVWDAEGKRYLDLTGAFGVASSGHANAGVVKAGQRQLAKLTHAMGDVHPHPLKAQLAQELSRITFERWHQGSHGKAIFCNSGFEAVEAALKTALLATGKPGVIAFEGGYHGLGYGALNTTHREHFRSRFRNQLREFGHFVPFPIGQAMQVWMEHRTESDHPHPNRLPKGQEISTVVFRVEKSLRELLERGEIGAVLVEPVQVRGGINIPAPGFLPMLRNICDAHGALLIVDEIYTGFGRTGQWFACEHWNVVPDLVCVGKALTNGFPLSACVGRAELMDAAWPLSNGEAIHTSTFLGHPVGCAMALAQIQEIENQDLVKNSRELGKQLLDWLQPVPGNCRGLGLLAGVELNAGGKPETKRALWAVKELLNRGFIFLPEGEHSNVISFSPPLTISGRQLRQSVDALHQVLTEHRT